MSKSQRVRHRDVCQAYRLIGECRDLALDPAAWQRRMFEGLCELLGAPAATGGEAVWPRPSRPLQPVSIIEVGHDPVFRERFLAFMRENGVRAEPIMVALEKRKGRLLTYTRRELVDDATWYRSVYFNDYRKVGRSDDQVTSLYQTSDEGTVLMIGVCRDLQERKFQARERNLLRFFHGELGPLIGAALASTARPPYVGLSPRLRQTLERLLEGDSEKQAAVRLGLSRATVHQYVTDLYRHFGVASRAELLASFLRRFRARNQPGLGDRSDA
jgi:DNA-binding CsgD family transcriptional regulator